jgi:hypothetical protein
MRMGTDDRGEAVGTYELRANLDDLARLPDGERVPLVTLGAGAAETTVAVSRSGGRAQVAVWAPDAGRRSDALSLAIDGDVTFRVTSDPRVPTTPVAHHAEEGVEVRVPGVGGDPVHEGRAGAAPGVRDRFPGTVTRLPEDRSTCRALAS